MTQRFAVIGNPISHSLSPVIHQHFAQETGLELRYEKIQGIDSLFEDQVSDFFRQYGKGINVTLPFKQRAFALAAHRTQRCTEAGAANTLWMERGQIHADNTDGIGLCRDLGRYLVLKEKNILILGAGGAARGIIHPLLNLQPEQLTIVNRSQDKIKELQTQFPQVNYAQFDTVHGHFDLIINATSASISGESPLLSPEIMSHRPFCYDLGYKQNEETPFVHYAQRMGCQSVDGLGMLVEQAAEAFYIWNKVMPTTSKVLEILRAD